jgi:SAM-dependent methyltransferase
VVVAGGEDYGPVDIPMSNQLLEAGRQYWDQTAETYDQIFPETLVGRAQRGAVWKELEQAFQSGQRVLELNCGTGIDAVHLAKKGIRVLACDLSPRMIEVAVRRSVASEVANLTDFRAIPSEEIAQLIPEGPFDGAFSNFSGLNHVEDLSQVARDLGRLLHPGARVLACMIGRIAPWEVMWQLAHRSPRMAMRRVRPQLVNPKMKAYYPSVRGIARAFAPNFRLLHWQGIGIAVPPTCMERWARRFPTVLKGLVYADQWLTHCPGVRSLGDCVLLHFERLPIG